MGSKSKIKIVKIERITNKQGKTEYIKVIFDGNLPKKNEFKWFNLQSHKV